MFACEDTTNRQTLMIYGQLQVPVYFRVLTPSLAPVNPNNKLCLSFTCRSVLMYITPV